MFEVTKSSSDEGVSQRRSSPKAADKNRPNGGDFGEEHLGGNSGIGMGYAHPNGYTASSSSSSSSSSSVSKSSSSPPSHLSASIIGMRSPDSPSKLPRKRRPGSAAVPGSLSISDMYLVDRKACILLFFGVILFILLVVQLTTGYGFMYSGSSDNNVYEKDLEVDIVAKEIETETSILADLSGPPDTDEAGHTFTLGIERLHQCMFDLSVANNEGGLPLGSTLVNENNYYSHHISVNHDHFIYGQICVESHTHEHIIELYLSSADHASVDNSHNHDCDLYISANNRLPTDVDWDFRSVNIGSDHIKLPLYLDDFKDSHGSVVIGIKGRGETVPELNQCTLTLKINTIENEELLHKFNLRHGQVLLPRDIKGDK